MTRTDRLLRIYSRVTQDYDLGPVSEDERARAIAREMEDIARAGSVEAAMQVIEWWGWDKPEEHRAVTRRLWTAARRVK